MNLHNKILSGQNYLSQQKIKSFMDKLPFILLWIFAFLLSVLAGWTAIQIHLENLSKMYIFLFIGLHLLSTASIFLSPFVYPFKEDSNIRFHANLSGCISFFLPVIGAIGCTIMFFTIKNIIKPKGLVDVFQDSTKRYVEKILFEEEVKDINLFMHYELNVDPIIDILDGNDDNLKRGAIEFLLKLSTPEAVKLIKKCLTDNNTEVRFYAHSSLTKLDEKYNHNISEELSLNKSDKVTEKSYFNIGNVYREYAESGLLDKETAFHYSSLAIEAYRTYLKENPTDTQTMIYLGKLDCDAKNYENAIEFYVTAIKMGSKSAEAFLGLCKVYYDQKNMNALAQTVQKMNDVEKFEFTNDQDKMLVQFWINNL